MPSVRGKVYLGAGYRVMDCTAACCSICNLFIVYAQAAHVEHARFKRVV